MQTTSLDKLAAQEGISRAELIRRLLNRALIGADDSLTSDLEAIAASFGSLRDFDPVERGPAGREDHLARVWHTTS